LLVSHDRAFLNNVVTSTLAIEPDGLVGDYDGGYDDYVRQRPEPGLMESKSSGTTAKAQTSEASPKRKKLGFKEKREMEALPEQIENLESLIRALHANMADPSFYKRDRIALAQSKARLDELEQALAAAFRRWEELEEAAD